MVSWEIFIRLSFGYRRVSQHDTCSGDQFWLSLNAMHSRRRRSWLSLQALGLRARDHAAASASAARYRTEPPFRATSREIVDTGLFKRAAMLLSDSSWLSPREISSRSRRVRASGFRLGTAGEMPPFATTKPKTEPGGFCSARAISLSVWPARQRCQSSVFSLGHKPRLRTCMRHHLLQPSV